MSVEIYNGDNSREDEMCPFCKKFVRQNGGSCNCEESIKNDERIAEMAEEHEKKIAKGGNGNINKKCLKK